MHTCTTCYTTHTDTQQLLPQQAQEDTGGGIEGEGEEVEEEGSGATGVEKKKKKKKKK
jgi:hypothetical protein